MLEINREKNARNDASTALCNHKSLFQMWVSNSIAFNIGKL